MNVVTVILNKLLGEFKGKYKTTNIESSLVFY